MVSKSHLDVRNEVHQFFVGQQERPASLTPVYSSSSIDDEILPNRSDRDGRKHDRILDDRPVGITSYDLQY